MNVQLDDVRAVQEALDTEWGYELSNNQMISRFCPICFAKIGWDEKGDNPQIAVVEHKQYHLDMARLLSGLQSWHTPIG